MKPPQRGVLLLAHGTVSNVAELPSFLARVRRGRPAPDELVAEMQRRYEAIGGSPLLDVSRQQAGALEKMLGIPCDVAMRLWHPEVAETLPGLLARGVTQLCLLPMAPFSVDVYVSAAQRVLDTAARGEQLQVSAVSPWGTNSDFIELQARKIRSLLTGGSEEHLILTAHSLPEHIIAQGDAYAKQFTACGEAVAKHLGRPWSLAYQSQGTDGGAWLGPSLLEVMTLQRSRGARRLVVAPIGFVAEHIETLYDLDIEAQAQARQVGVELVRVSTVTTEPEFVEVLASEVQAAFEAAPLLTRPV